MTKVIFEVNELQDKDLIGCLVVSTAGRDKDARYILVKYIDEQNVLVANGATKTFEKPKKKKLKHLLLTSVINEEIITSILLQDKNWFKLINTTNNEESQSNQFHSVVYTKNRKLS